MSLRDDLRQASLTNALSDEQLDDLMTLGRLHEFAPGDELFREARPADHLWILLAGEIELSQQHGSERVVYANMADPGQWTGGHAAWGSADANAVFLVTGTALTEGRCYVVPSPELARFVDRWLPLSRHLLDAVYQTVRRVDADARQRASLVALGKLSAGLAHEINNPASAAMFIINPLSGARMDALFSTHPRVENRIAALQAIAGEAVPGVVRGGTSIPPSGRVGGGR